MENIFTTVLRRASEAQGSAQALARALRVPEGTLRLWMSGRAPMPLAAFRWVVALVAGLEPAEPPAAAPPDRWHTLTFMLRDVMVRCTHCGGAEFLSPLPADTLPYTARLHCASCSAEAIHQDLLDRLAAELRLAAKASRALAAAGAA